MKILIAYDGSAWADAAIDDLTQAGLPPDAEALVLTLTEFWLPSNNQLSVQPPKEIEIYEVRRLREMAAAALEQAGGMAEAAGRKVRERYPLWKVRHEAGSDSPAWGIIRKADEWKPDLIVVGSHGRNVVGRFVLGSVSLKVLTEAECSVRIARTSEARVTGDESPLRLVVGIDGSRGSEQAVDAVSRRTWREGSAVRLVTALDPILYGAFLEQDTKRVEDLQSYAAHTLGSVGLHVSSVVRDGDPKRVLIEEAETWGADAIFIGAKGHHFMERMLLGSVSYAVAARAHCSVEIVRQDNAK